MAESGFAEAVLTVKESKQHGNRIYSLKLEEIKKPTVLGEEALGTNADNAAHTVGSQKVAQIAGKINGILNQQARGSIEFPAVAVYGQPARINLSPKDDFSTVAHEMAHFYLWNLGQISQYGNISDLSVISKWWGESSGDIIGWMNGKGKELFSAELLKGLSGDSFAAWLADPTSVSGELAAAYGTATQEYFARGFEAYPQICIFCRNLLNFDRHKCCGKC